MNCPSKLGIEVGQVVSDLCGALTSYTKDISAQHSPDLFHGQHELTKATAAPLSSQERAFDAMVSLLTSYLLMLGLYVDGLQLPEDQSRFFLDVVFPFAYLRMILKRQSKEGKKKLKALIDSLEIKIREGPWAEALNQSWIKEASNLAELFQRSSSCVEGRNGMLSLLHHRCHRLSTDRLKALTVVHNYHRRRVDGSTAAERFFEQGHSDLFEYLTLNVRIPGKPQLVRKSTEMKKADAA